MKILLSDWKHYSIKEIELIQKLYEALKLSWSKETAYCVFR